MIMSYHFVVSVTKMKALIYASFLLVSTAVFGYVMLTQPNASLTSNLVLAGVAGLTSGAVVLTAALISLLLIVRKID